MNHGGNRKNSGRPKGSLATHTLEAQTLRQYMIQEVIANKKELVEALIEKAKAGEVSALKEVFDRSLGKVKDSMEISTRAESPLAPILRFIRASNKGIIAERVVQQPVEPTEQAKQIIDGDDYLRSIDERLNKLVG